MQKLTTSANGKVVTSTAIAEVDNQSTANAAPRPHPIANGIACCANMTDMQAVNDAVLGDASLFAFLH